MKKLRWDFVIPLKSEQIFDEFEKEYHCEVPDALRSLVTQYNAGMPSPDHLRKGDMDIPFNNLLSWNRNDTDSVYSFVDAFLEDGVLTKLPFGLDGFGNVFCVDAVNEQQIKLWHHETDTFLFLAKDLNAFFNMMCD